MISAGVFRKTPAGVVALALALSSPVIFTARAGIVPIRSAAAAYQSATNALTREHDRSRNAYQARGIVVDVQALGAVGDGHADDTDAFARAAAIIQRLGGGTIFIRRGVYLVGRQRAASRSGLGFAYRSEDIISLSDCPRPVAIIGDHAVLRVTPGLRYGAFDPATGLSESHDMPFVNRDYVASLGSMISVQRCADVQISGLELDGNVEALRIGGEWGDTGRQIPAIGIFASGNEHLGITDVFTHHHALDGIQIGYPGLRDGAPPKPHELSRVRSENNGRQGLSWVGGNSLVVTNSSFSHTGKGRIATSPGAGVDIEPEGSICRNGLFVETIMLNNAGSGVVADSGDSADLTFVRCTFWGTTNWSAWLRKPHILLAGCEVYGDYPEPFVSPEHLESDVTFIDCKVERLEHPMYGVFRYYRTPLPPPS